MEKLPNNSVCGAAPSESSVSAKNITFGTEQVMQAKPSKVPLDICWTFSFLNQCLTVGGSFCR